MRNGPKGKITLKKNQDDDMTENGIFSPRKKRGGYVRMELMKGEESCQWEEIDIFRHNFLP